MEAISTKGPFAVIVSDLRMPGMDGIQFLRKARELAPDSVRIMLTGNGDIEAAIEAVNEGNIFRFLTKPCLPDKLEQAINAGMQQHRLITAERELLEQTLHGAVRMLVELLSIAAPQSFGHAEKVRNAVRVVSEKLSLPESWELEVASMVCQIGFVTIPPAVIENAKTGRPLGSLELKMISRVPEIGRDLLNNIPRLEAVAKIVEYQNKHFDGTGFPENGTAGNNIPIGSRILKAVNDLIQIEDLGIARGKALHIMKKRLGWYDPEVLAAVSECQLPIRGTGVSGPIQTISIADLQPGMILARNYNSSDGTLLVAAGCHLSEAVITKIRNSASYFGATEQLSVESALSQIG